MILLSLLFLDLPDSIIWVSLIHTFIRILGIEKYEDKWKNNRKSIKAIYVIIIVTFTIISRILQIANVVPALIVLLLFAAIIISLKFNLNLTDKKDIFKILISCFLTFAIFILIEFISIVAFGPIFNIMNVNMDITNSINGLIVSIPARIMQILLIILTNKKREKISHLFISIFLTKKLSIIFLMTIIINTIGSCGAIFTINVVITLSHSMKIIYFLIAFLPYILNIVILLIIYIFIWKLLLKDKLTETYNRSYFEPMFKIYQNKKDLSLIMLDIDHFKKVNDTYGHNAGDLVLKEFSAQIKKCIREKDVFVRYGGEEFLLLVPADLTEATKIAERIRTTIESTIINYNNTIIPITVSIGIAKYNGQLQENFIKEADIALYQAKNNGRNQIITFK